MKIVHSTILFILVATLLIRHQTFGQQESPAHSDSVRIFSGFSAERFPAKRSTRGSSVALEDLSAFSAGAIKLFNFRTQYKKVFLGADFYDEATHQTTCDSLKNFVGRTRSHFIPVSDGMFFDKSSFKKIEELEGYYRFRNNKNLPGILPNVDVWVKMETYRHGRSSEKNCLVVKFLIPENINGKIEDKAYALRNDGILVAVPVGTDPDFSLKMDFNQYCIFPLNDVQQTTHLVGNEYNILGSFARQKQCVNISGLLFPITRKGTSTGCIFFRKMKPELSPRF